MYGILRRGGHGADAVITITKAAGGYVLHLPPKPKDAPPVYDAGDAGDAGDAKLADMTARELVRAVREEAAGTGCDDDPEPEIHVCADLVAVMARVRECFEPDAAQTA